MKELLGITCAEEEITVATTTPNKNIWELRIPLRFTEKNPYMQNCLMTSPVVKSLHDNKFCKHQSPECLGFQRAQTKKISRFYFKILFIHKIRRNVLECSCAFDLTHLGSNEQCRTPRGDVTLLQTHSSLTKHFLENLISPSKVICKWPIVPVQHNISLLYKQNPFA